MRFIYLLLFVSPLPFASARPIWQYTWVLFIALSGLVYSLKWKSLNTVKLPKSYYFSVGGLALLIGWGACQTLMAWSITPQHTIGTTLFFFSHLVWFFLVFNSFHHRTDGPKFVLMIGFIVTAYSIYGLIVYSIGNETILWYAKNTRLDLLTSTFVNRNNFATYAGIGLQCMLAYGLWSYDQREIENTSILEAIAKFFTRDFTKTSALVLSLLILLSALLLTGSRAGITTTIGGVLFLLITSSLVSSNKNTTQSKKLKTISIVAFSIIAFIVFFELSGELYEKRMSNIGENEMRFLIYSLTLDAIKDMPVYGYGLGTFAEVFAQYRTAELPKPIVRNHSDILEIILTSGTIVGSIFIASLLSIFISLFRLAFKDAEYKLLLLLIVSIFIQVGFHSLVDFPLQVPAVGYLLTALLSVGAFLTQKSLQEVKQHSPRTTEF